MRKLVLFGMVGVLAQLIDGVDGMFANRQLMRRIGRRQMQHLRKFRQHRLQHAALAHRRQ